jgi:hypothetical protein
MNPLATREIISDFWPLINFPVLFNKFNFLILISDSTTLIHCISIPSDLVAILISKLPIMKITLNNHSYSITPKDHSILVLFGTILENCFIGHFHSI